MAAMCVAPTSFGVSGLMRSTAANDMCTQSACISSISWLTRAPILGIMTCRYEAGGLLATDDGGVGVIAGSTLGGGMSILPSI